MAGYFGSLFGGGAGAGQGSPSAFTNPMVDPRQLALLMALQNQGQGGAMQAGPRSFGTPGAAPGMPQPPQGLGANGAPRIGPNANAMQGQPGAGGALTPQQIQQLLLQLRGMTGQMGASPGGVAPMVAPAGPPQ